MSWFQPVNALAAVLRNVPLPVAVFSLQTVTAMNDSYLLESLVEMFNSLKSHDWIFTRIWRGRAFASFCLDLQGFGGTLLLHLDLHHCLVGENSIGAHVRGVTACV